MTQMRSAVLTVSAVAVSAVVLLAAVLLRAQPAVPDAQGAPSDGVLQGFLPSSEYMLVVDGQPVPEAEIYKNDQVPAVLILSSSLPSPVMLSPRTSKVESVDLTKIARQEDGSVDLVADAVLTPVGQFQLEGENVTFVDKERKVSLNPRPALTGLHEGVDLLAEFPEYVRASAKYQPNAEAIAALKAARQPVTVHVVFGSWCPHCAQHVPLMLRVESEVSNNPKVKFEYYGIAQPPDGWKDPEFKRLGVKGVPAAIVLVDGVEAGRIEGEPWSAPEVALAKIVSGKASPENELPLPHNR
jgi:thiol-disulfide isomerase/thioredoxin